MPEHRIHYCEHCGKPAIYQTWRTQNLNTESETTDKYAECRECRRMGSVKLFARNLSKEETDANEAFTKHCGEAVADLFTLVEKLEEDNHVHIQTSWRKVYNLTEKVPDGIKDMIAKIGVTDVGNSSYSIVTLLHCHQNETHQVELIVNNMTVAQIFNLLAPHVTVMPSANLVIRQNINDKDTTKSTLAVDADKMSPNYDKILGDRNTCAKWRNLIADETSDEFKILTSGFHKNKHA